MSQTIYLISGANRGIGLGLVQEVVKHPETVVYAAARDPPKATELQKLASDHPGRVHVVKLVSADEKNNRAVAKEIEAKYGRVDIVIANAGISNYMAPANETPVEQYKEHFEVNFIGTLVLFQAVFSLLKASKAPKFISMSTGVASSSLASLDLRLSCYASSKAALNYLAQSIHYENDWLVSFPLSPGVVMTDMSNNTRAMDPTGRLAGLQDPIAVSVEECSAKIYELVSKATRDDHGGKFLQFYGSTFNLLPY